MHAGYFNAMQFNRTNRDIQTPPSSIPTKYQLQRAERAINGAIVLIRRRAIAA